MEILVDLKKMDRAMDIMVLALADAGLDALTIGKFVMTTRRNFGLPAEEAAKIKLKSDFAQLIKEIPNDPSVDGSRKTGIGHLPGRPSKSGESN